MAVDLFIQNVPEDLVARLQERAARAHRSLQRELLTILELAVSEKRRLTPGEALAQVRALGLSTPSESAAWVREDRDARTELQNRG
jgi:plasmid stability protein